MNHRMPAGMEEATRLTQAGRLAEATAVIQRMLGGTLSPEDSSATSDGPVMAAAQPPSPTPILTPAALLPAGDVPATSAEPSDTSPREAQPTGQIARLRALLRRRPAGLGRQVPRPIPDQARKDVWAGGQFIEGSYSNGAGTRAYKLYVPSGYHGQALPLVVMLHGCTQAPDDFAAGTRMNVLAERDGFLVLYPIQSARANQSKCWNWFKASDQDRDQGEPSIIAGMTRQIMSTYEVDPRRVYVAGLSAGGAMAMIMGVSYPDLYAAMGVHSGLAYGVAHDLPSAFAAMKQGGKPVARRRDGGSPTAPAHARIVPTIVFHGDHDTTVHPRNGDQVLAHWVTTHGASDTAPEARLRATINSGQAPGGHAYTRSVYRDAGGQEVLERWLVHGAGHGWSGGSPHGTFTDAKGPDASQEIVRFFDKHSFR